MHSPEVQKLLQQYGELLGQDLAAYHVYGSASRPMSAAWARIPNAVYMQVDRQATGYHTYVATPSPLSQETINSYELTFVSKGSQAETLDPFDKMTHADFMEALKPENWKEVYQRLHTQAFDAFLFPDGRLSLMFPRQSVEALTRFLDQYANVEPLPAPDDSFLKDLKPTRVDE